MDVQRYISSGILESYVFGMLPEAERQEVETVVLQYPDVKAAVNLLQLDKERFIQLYAVAPPPGVKDRLVEIIQQENTEGGDNLPAEELRVPAASSVSQAGGAFAPAPGLPVKRSNGRMYKYVATAAILLLLGSIILNFIFFHKATGYKSRYNALLAAKEQPDAEKESRAPVMQETPQPATNPATNPEFKWTKIEGGGAYAGKSVSVGWNPRTQAVYLQAQLMPPPPTGKQFQLWAIVNRKLVDIGVFNTGENVSGQLQEMKAIAVAQGFAVTLEKAGGSPDPSMDQVCMSAKITK